MPDTLLSHTHASNKMLLLLVILAACKLLSILQSCGLATLQHACIT